MINRLCFLELRVELKKPADHVCLQTSCTMDQNLARLQNPHRFLRENRFLEGDDPSKLNAK